MLKLLAVLALAGLLEAKHVELPHPYTDYCLINNHTNRYDPNRHHEIPWFDISLDEPAETRWNKVSVLYTTQINNLIDVLIDFILPVFPSALEFVDTNFAEFTYLLPSPYKEEIISISNATGIPLGRITMYNIFYEIFTVCTSIVANQPNGNMIHARNLDFGLFMGWNATIHDWPISARLRQMIINVNWIKDGKVLFKSNNFAGYIGIYNGLKQNAFSITADDRFQLEGGYYGIIQWLLGLEPEGKWMSWLTRETLTNFDTYEDAKNHLMTTPMLSPVYYILGGEKNNHGCVIARNLEDTALLTEYNSTTWFILETNYDLNQEPLYLDDRDTPGYRCMNKLGKQNVGYEGIFNVLSSRTNLNKLTTYTVIMEVATGRFETILQSCPGDCYPW